MLEAIIINLCAISAVCLLNAILWVIHFRQCDFVKAAARRRTVYFFKHTFLYWSLAWLVWFGYYAYLLMNLLYQLPQLPFPQVNIFISDLNSVLFFGVYFAYLRGEDYSKYNFFVLGTSILAILTAFQLSIFALEEQYAILSIPITSSDGSTTARFMILHFTPSLLFSLFSYFMIGFAFFRRLGFQGLFLSATCFVYAGLQIPLQVEHYNKLDSTWVASQFGFVALAGLKLLIAVQFYGCLSLTKDSENLLQMSSRYVPKAELTPEALQIASARLRKLYMRLLGSGLAAVLVFAFSRLINIPEMMQVVAYSLMIAHYTWSLYKHFK